MFSETTVGRTSFDIALFTFALIYSVVIQLLRLYGLYGRNMRVTIAVLAIGVIVIVPGLVRYFIYNCLHKQSRDDDLTVGHGVHLQGPSKHCRFDRGLQRYP